VAGIITPVQDGSKPGHFDVQNIIDGLTGKKGQEFTFKTTAQRTQFQATDAGVKASYDLGVTAPTRVLVDAYDLKAGMIMYWNGTTLDIPACWRLCNGTLGTPDLRDRFMVGAGLTYVLGATGGSTTTSIAHAHSLSNHTHDLASHVHTGDQHSHSHAHTGAAHTHAHTHTGPNHSHTANGDGSGDNAVNLAFGGTDTTARHAHTHSTSSDGTGATGSDSTAASFSANTGTDAQNATFSTTTGTSSPNTSNGPSIDATSAATVTTAAILPPYVGLYLIQRFS
jgi:hypothetical protein